MEIGDTQHKLIPFVSSDGWHGLVWEGWEEEFKELDQWLNDHHGESVVDKPNRSVRRVEPPRGEVYVKIIRRLADGRHFWRDLLKRIRWYVRPSRALCVARISEAMLNDGVLCPVPLLSVRRRNGLGVPCDVMISEGLSAQSVLGVLRQASGGDRVWLELEHIAAELVRIHELGYVHGDAMPGNLLWDGSHLYFIDNDRTSRLGGFRLYRGRIRNLVQFCRGLEWELRSVESGERFMDLYERHSSPAFRLSASVRCDMQRRIRKSLIHGFRKNGLESWLPQEES